MKQRLILAVTAAALVPLGVSAIASTTGSADLEKKIAQALATNPEIQMAQAKVLQAEAEYRVVRLRVAQEVLESHNDYETQMHLLQASHRRLDQARLESDQGLRTKSDLSQLEMELIQAENRLSQIKARERYVLGAQLPDGGGSGSLLPSAKERDPVPTYFIDDLAVPVAVHFEESTVREILDTFSGLMMGSGKEGAMRIVLDEEMLDMEFSIDDPVTLKAGTVPLGHALLMLADKKPVRFVFREYGLLATTEDRALYMSGASIPAGLPLDD